MNKQFDMVKLQQLTFSCFATNFPNEGNKTNQVNRTGFIESFNLIESQGRE